MYIMTYVVLYMCMGSNWVHTYILFLYWVIIGMKYYLYFCVSNDCEQVCYLVF